MGIFSHFLFLRLPYGVKGFSPQNLWKMRQFHLEYKDNQELKELAFQIPWGQNILIFQKIKDDKREDII